MSTLPPTRTRMRSAIRGLLPAALLGLAACGGGGSSSGTPVTPTTVEAAAPTPQELQCQASGWRREVVVAGGLPRLVLWKGPPGAWTQGALLVMHGGGGTHTNFCVANVALIEPQVRFTSQALAQGFAVFLLDSSDRVTDRNGRLCGKVWDDEVRARDNLDLPFIEQVLTRVVPAQRPAGSRTEVFVTGHSSGGYMAVRAASRLGERITAFAPVSSGDPYGWTRDCSPRPGDRPNVFGAGFDNETGRQIVEPGACSSPSQANEQPWDGATLGPKPAFRVFHHAQDGINDRSCVDKVRRQLVARGYPEAPPFMLDGGSRNADVHYWLDDYNTPLLAYFGSQRR